MPVVEVILPAARRAVAATRSGRVGVICTEATATSQAYDDAFAAAPQVELHTAACPRFVAFVEAGITGGPELLAVRRGLPAAARQTADIDTLILGCTHYPLLTGVISYVLGDGVSLVSSAEECAKELFAVLTRHGLTHDRPRLRQPPVPDHRQPGRVRGHRVAADGRPGRRRGAVRVNDHADRRRLQRLDLRAGVARPPATWSRPRTRAAPSPWSSTSARARSAPSTAISTPAEVDAFGLSHLHPDHCLDLCAYYVAARYSPTAPWPRRPLFGPAGTPQRLARAYDVPLLHGAGGEPGPGIDGALRLRRSGSRASRSARSPIETARVDHPVEAYAMRVTENVPSGGTLVFSGDTGPCAALVDLARGADLLLVEAAFLDGPDNPPGLHLTGRQAAEAGAAAGVGAVRAHPHPAVARPRPGAGRGDAALRRTSLTGGDRGESGK